MFLSLSVLLPMKTILMKMNTICSFYQIHAVRSHGTGRLLGYYLSLCNSRVNIQWSMGMHPRVCIWEAREGRWEEGAGNLPSHSRLLRWVKRGGSSQGGPPWKRTPRLLPDLCVQTLPRPTPEPPPDRWMKELMIFQVKNSLSTHLLSADDNI